MNDRLNHTLSLLDQVTDSKEKVIVILGPTASGKTKLAINLAEQVKAEIISADSRQIYRGMDIGTGKDLAEYQDIPYHLINILEPGAKYNLGNFINDFHQAHQCIKDKGKRTILCGGTGLYLQSVIQQNPYALIPAMEDFKDSLADYTEAELTAQLHMYQIPADFKIDYSTKKRLTRAIEILEFLNLNPDYLIEQHRIESIVIGLNPPVDSRRERISTRLHQRIEVGLVQEVEDLLARGLSHEQLQYYGLEYKYVSFYLLGQLDHPSFIRKLETEIHRYAKRQMTYFRKMEKDGIKIHWL